jgi:KipI family sensor histidine kinase inhibitor
MPCPTYQPLGDQGVLIQFEERIDPGINERVRFLSKVIEERRFPWLHEVVFSFRNLLVIYDPRLIQFQKVVEAVKRIESTFSSPQAHSPDVYEIPTLYGGPYGPDLNRAAEITGYSPKEVIEIFSSTVFTIYFLGFLCAQPYLGGLPEALQVPRLEGPRLHVPAGSVGIGGIQAGVISIDQPSGFNFIGRTFLSIYEPTKIPPTCLQAGDQITFPSLLEDQALRVKGSPPVLKKGKGIE